jgi:peptidoglycan/LPS O-acetylase OafA/YrhL
VTQLDEHAGHARVQPHIQGLRGVAVLLVVVYHTGFGFPAGGFVGVDVFFVISGYLISAMLFREASACGRIDYVRFLARRARRLLPAASVVLLAVAGISLYVYPPLERESVLSASRAAAVYLSNVWFSGRAIDYLGGDGDENPVLHTWSLAVEEQFYIVWPFVVALATRYAKEGKPWASPVVVMSGILVLSLGACVWVTCSVQPLAFFGTPFRAWEFAMGALVFLHREALCRLGHRMQAIGALAGILLIASSAILLNEQSLFPGPWALVPTLGTATVLACAMGEAPSVAKSILSFRPVTRLGDISYSLYLWHWPILTMSRAAMANHDAGLTLMSLAVALVLADTSYRFVEEPIRRRVAAKLSARVVVLIAVSSTITLTVGLTLLKESTAGGTANPMSKIWESARTDLPSVYSRGCHTDIDSTEVHECVSGSRDSRDVIVLFGDSHAAQWHPALEQIAASSGLKLVSITKSACPPIDGTVFLDSRRRRYHECTLWKEEAMRRIAALSPLVVILGSSSRYFAIDALDWEQASRRTVSRLRTTGASIVLMRDTPWPGFNVPTCLARAQHFGRPLSVCNYHLGSALHSGLRLFQAEESAALAGGARIIDMSPYICPKLETCSVLAGDMVYFSDGNHLAARFVSSLAARLRAELFGDGSLANLDGSRRESK